jgi:uncharacterized membrane protein
VSAKQGPAPEIAGDDGRKGELSMLLIGLLIVAAAAVFAGVVVSANWGGPRYEISGFGHVLGHLTLAQIFLAGVVLTAIFFLGLWVASVSNRMRRRTSSRRRAESRAAREEHESVVAERDRLAGELATQQAAASAQPIVLDRPAIHDTDVFGQRTVDPSSTESSSR